VNDAVTANPLSPLIRKPLHLLSRRRVSLSFPDYDNSVKRSH
jgi:hypothetical protein